MLEAEVPGKVDRVSAVVLKAGARVKEGAGREVLEKDADRRTMRVAIRIGSWGLHQRGPEGLTSAG